jgi:TolA-binding protein
MVATSGCAYYNTFYNAKGMFKKAEEERIASAGMQGGENYQQCIDKCLTLLQFYPNSKYVDDALFLIAMSRLHRGENAQARASFEGLLERFPETEYAERALFNMGLAALRQNDTPGAARAFEQLESRFPGSALGVEAVFRRAEVQLGSGDYDEARREVNAFIAAHPNSPLVGEARIRIARTYEEEQRWAEAQAEYARVLEHDTTPESRLDAQIRGSLALRAQAEDLLANPALQPFTRMHIAAATSRRAGRSVVAGMGVAARDSLRRVANPTGRSNAIVDSSRVDGNSAGPEDAEPSQKPPEVPPAEALPPLTPELAAELARAEEMLSTVLNRLIELRKPASRLGRKDELEIEIAVTRALVGEPEEAASDLDQRARAAPKSDISARAHYEIGEIRRRLGFYDQARESYDASLREKRGTPISDLATRKSAAISSRSAAIQGLQSSADVLARWRVAQRDSVVQRDSLGVHIGLTAEFETLASKQLQVAEIDLLELDQPLLALGEFERVLTDYAASLSAPRAAFGIAWIYDYRLRDAARAQSAYQRVVRDFGATPQGREAQAILAAWSNRSEGETPSSPP